MGDIEEFSQLCRLCLVKEEVNVPIFDESSDIRQTFLKISSCLPVKVSPEDNLPKKICDGCSYKLDMLYVFRNTSVDSEKQLLSWLDQAGLDGETVKDGLGAKAEVMVKQEAFEPIDTRIEDGEEGSDIGVDAQSYIIQQQQLSYEQDFSYGEEDEPTDPTVDPIATDEPAPKRVKRNASKRPVLDETEDELDSALHITKAEDDDEDVDQHDYLEATEAPSTSADDQPGPSGVGKGTVEAPQCVAKTAGGRRSFLSCAIKKESSDEDYKPPIAHRIKEERDERQSKTWPCKKCKLTLPTRKELIKHRRMHRTIKKEVKEDQCYNYDTTSEVYTCTTCSAEFQGEEEVQAHVTKSHIETYVCGYCDEKFSDPYTFCCHVQQHDVTQRYACPLCPYATERRTCIFTHINRMHYYKFYYYCETCGKGFNDSVRHKEHENEHLGLKPFVCIVCAKAFVYSRYLYLHQLRHHTVGIAGQLLKNQCPSCLRVFSKDKTLVNHIACRHGSSGAPREKRGTSGAPREKRYLCDICGKSFATTDKMKIHYRIHTGIKPYSCSYCSKSFIKRDYLIMHERVHTGEKPYSCKFCGKCFNQGAPLRIHIRGHTGERPYVCQFCNNGFVSKGSLTIHQKVCMGRRD